MPVAGVAGPRTARRILSAPAISVPVLGLAQPIEKRRRKRRPFEINPPEDDFEANEAILRDAGDSYDPDPMGRLGRGTGTRPTREQLSQAKPSPSQLPPSGQQPAIPKVPGYR